MNKASPLPNPLGQHFDLKANDNAKKLSEQTHNKKFERHFDRLLSDIWFSSEAESTKPENVEKTKQAFRKFLKNMDWPVAAFCFEELLNEKSGEFEFRADGKTPNWYHEFRETLWALNFIKQGLISERSINAFGGAEILTVTILAHDSWEDFGKSAKSIVQKLQTHTRALNFSNKKTERYDFKIDSAGVGIDRLTRKVPILDKDGNFVRKENGKILKVDRFNGDVLEYYQMVLGHPFSAFAKPIDGIEGMVTRVGVESFTVEDDKKYAEERRMLYGRQSFDRDAILLHPFLEPAILSVDSMLGISLVMLETLNDFAPNSANKSSNARKINIEKYTEHAPKGFEGLPAAFHPIHIKMGRMIAKSLRENDGRVENIIKRAFMPALIETFPNLTIYNNFSASTALPRDAAYAPNAL